MRTVLLLGFYTHMHLFALYFVVVKYRTAVRRFPGLSDGQIPSLNGVASKDNGI